MSNALIVLLTALCTQRSIAVLGAYDCSGTQECPVNSSAVLCGSLCEPTCVSPRVVCLMDTSAMNCKMDCRCNHGFVRNRVTNECVELKDCPYHSRWIQKIQRCPFNSTWTLCGRGCEPTCEFPGLACTIYNRNCTMDCSCRDGFVRNHVTNDCVVIEDCPVSGTTTARSGEADDNLNAQ